MPPLLRDIVKMVLDEQPDMRVVGAIADDEKVVETVRRRRADFLVWGIDAEVENRCTPVLEAHPRVRILAVEDRGRTGTLYVLRPHKSSLGPLSRTRLIKAVRKVAR